MDRDLWSGLAVFAQIVEAGSFAKAAKRLGLSPSALSHAMRVLETKLDIRLLDRTTRSLAPTSSGEALLERLRPAMASVGEVLGMLDTVRERPIGRVRINAHRPAAVHLILPRLPALTHNFPEVLVDLIVNDGLVDLVAEGFDCGVRHAAALQGDMISVRISDPVSLIFVASPAYLKTHNRPEHPDDLGHHRCISYRHTTSGTLHRWEFEQNGWASQRVVPASFVTNDVDVMRDAALSGLGVACLIAEQASPHLLSGDLVEVLPGWGTTLPSNHLYYPSRRQPSAAFRAFLNAMRAS